MAKRRKSRIRWGRVINALAALGIVVFLAVKGITLLFGYIGNIEFGNLIGNKNYVATVVIDPGHGGWDNGCAKNDLLEKDVNLRVSQEIVKILDKNNIKAVLTRTDDTALADEKNKDLAARIKMAEDNKARYFVSIHVNSYDGHEAISGYEVYTKNKDSEAIANSVINSLKTVGFENSRGVYDGNTLYVLRRNNVNSIIVEMGYINSSDFDYLNNDEKMKEFAVGIADGIISQIENELGINDDTNQ